MPQRDPTRRGGASRSPVLLPAGADPFNEDRNSRCPSAHRSPGDQRSPRGGRTR
jgi:hypothetical protein